MPQYLMYRPANSVPYATVETNVDGVFLKYCMMDAKGRLITRTISEVEQKCCTFQHWIHQWTHGNLLVTRMEGKNQRGLSERTKKDSYNTKTESVSGYMQWLMLFCFFDFVFLVGVGAKITNIQVVTKSKGFVFKSLYAIAMSRVICLYYGLI